VAKAGGKFDALVRARSGDHGDGSDDRRREDDALRPEVGVGKRSNAEYRQVSAYIRKDTHRKVKMALIEEDQQFSELVGRLLKEWLDTRS
jgi:hypothetical protein